MARIMVRVKKLRDKGFGFYDNKRRYSGDVFSIVKEKDFSKKWMEKIDENTPPPKVEKNQQITGDPKTKVHTTGPHAGAKTTMVDGIPVGDPASEEVI